MFKHILLPTDGSSLSNRAVKRGIEFARKIRARVTALHVMPEFKAFADEGFVPLSPILKKTPRGQAQTGRPKCSRRSRARPDREKCGA